MESVSVPQRRTPHSDVSQRHKLKKSPLNPGKKTLKSKAILSHTAPIKASKKKITGVSKKVAKYNQEFAFVKPLVMARDEHLCQVAELRYRECFWNHALHVHHKLPRSQGGSNDIDNLITLCQSCHAYVHDNHDWAVENGFLLDKPKKA